MECDKSVDSVWYAATMGKQKMRELEEAYKKENEEMFRFKPLDEISDLLNEYEEFEEQQEAQVDKPFEVERKPLEVEDTKTHEDDAFPKRFRHKKIRA